MKTLEQCQAEVAKKHRLGNSLVTGHKVGFFNEATEIYIGQFYSEAQVKLLTATAFGAGKTEKLWSEWWNKMDEAGLLKK